MKLTTADCRQYIADWVQHNPGQLPVDAYKIKVKAGGATWISDGTKPKDWTRLAKKKIGKVEYRLFNNQCSIFGYRFVMLLEEEDCQLSHSYGDMRSFQDHPAVGEWIKEHCGIK